MSDDESEFLGLDKKEKTTIKYLAALLVMVKVMFLGCGETKEITTEHMIICGRSGRLQTVSKRHADIIKRVNSTGIITDEQAESLSKVESLSIGDGFHPLIDKYKNQ